VIFYGTDRGVPRGKGIQGRPGNGERMKSQISDTKNPGLSTRVFAIDSK
jgi:hypothetical protein